VATSGDNLFFFLGGYDLEMLTIRDLLDEYAPGRYCDRGLSWGAKTSDYRAEIVETLGKGITPVLVELTDNMGLQPHPYSGPLSDDDGVVFVDHHGLLAGADKPTSLHQIFALLGLPSDAWTRRMELIAANDRGYIRGMLDAGATRDEINAIRAADRAAQGITEEQERQAAEAIQESEEVCRGRLTVVRLPHNRTAAVADRLAPELGRQGYENLLVISPCEVNFFGSGELVFELDRTFPGGWSGGCLPDQGFWGHGEPVPDVLYFLRERLNDSD
jgi:hypothetical protein